MSSEIAIKVTNLSKCYHIYDKPHDRLLQMLTRGRKKFYREFWALNNVSFEIKKGETVGIIGRNGSGKSTLLQMICGMLNPTHGTIETHGRIAALLELGSGFNPEFTGRENVYMNATLLGLSKEEIDSRFNDIAVFADIGDFIDQPTKTYSSGMAVRLAFAVQAQIEPSILIVDEALAVGDAKFQAKCFERLKQLKENGTSILLVTHSSEQIVTHCSQAILLDNGTAIDSGEPKRVVNHYLDLLFGKVSRKTNSLVIEIQPENITIKPNYGLSATIDFFSKRPGYNPHEYRWGDGAAKILDFYLAADNEPYPSAITSGQSITVCLSIQFLVSLLRPILGITIKTKEGITIYGANSETLQLKEFHMPGEPGKVIQSEASFQCMLAPGDYFISLGIATRQGEEIIPHDRRYDAIHFHVLPNTTFFGLADLSLNLTAQEVHS